MIPRIRNKTPTHTRNIEVALKNLIVNYNTEVHKPATTTKFSVFVKTKKSIRRDECFSNLKLTKNYFLFGNSVKPMLYKVNA